MKAIGFKNFRKFENFPSIALGDVTYLVGQNNSGKSTMVKAAILVLENLRKKSVLLDRILDKAYFSFESEIHNLHINTFNRAIHRKCADEHQIQFAVSFSNLDFEITMGEIFDKYHNDRSPKENARDAIIESLIVNDKKLGIKFDMQGRGCFELEFINIATDKVGEHIKSTCDTSNKSDLLNYDKVQKNRSSDKSSEEVEERIMIDFGITKGSENPEFSIVGDLLHLIRMTKDEIFIERIGREERQKLIQLRRYSSVLSKMAEDINSLLNNIDVSYLPVHLCSQKTVLRTESNDIFAREIDTYYQYTKQHDFQKAIYKFIQKWMDAEHFNIGKGFEIEELERGYYKLLIETFDNGLINVCDMGFGTNQLMMLLLFVANKLSDSNFVRSFKPILFIEEPELNLHPNLQSKLAEFFYEIATGHHMQIIVETHSEYMIRKSQYLVAKQKYKDENDLKNNPQKVLFFPQNGLPYDMEYQINGLFNKKFDSGFFDEAGNAAIELMSKVMS